ncbi:MAG: peptide chain release factor N(5)-glutamine methyltransferase [Treponema sp.]|nr:peptide chain release factor N(5)-glutamine methyltransferase [Treponema sp.]MBP3608233.1 peptide chain release factor N(5)-glutamine methyltransferase [Treponema sp.]
MKLGDVRKDAIELLKKTSPSPELDIDLIISNVLNKNRTWITFHRDEYIAQEDFESIKKATTQRLTGLPIAYITNKKEFYGYDFYVNQDVLIPKPDTELMIDLAINIIGQKMANHSNYIPTICDMCTGSGCVGISILKTLHEIDNIQVAELPKITMVDISQKALCVAKKNSESLLKQEMQERISFLQSNLFDEIPYKFDLIVTNPPYIPHNEVLELLKDGRNEPILALDGDILETGDYSNTNDGLELIRRLVPQAYDHLSPRGQLIMETGEYNAEEAAEILKSTGFKDIKIEKDLAGQLRDVLGRK